VRVDKSVCLYIIEPWVSNLKAHEDTDQNQQWTIAGRIVLAANTSCLNTKIETHVEKEVNGAGYSRYMPVELFGNGMPRQRQNSLLKP